MQYRVLDNDRDATAEGIGMNSNPPCWSNNVFSTSKDAAQYLKDWLGSYAYNKTVEEVRNLTLNQRHYYNNLDWVMIHQEDD